MTESMQRALRQALAELLRPIVRLMLTCGLSYVEFSEIAKSIFVSIASDSYGLRGRPTSISRVAAMTGLSRKDISRMRSDAAIEDWSPRLENNPVNTLIHHWHFDPEFSHGQGQPRELSLGEFRALVRRFARDIPPGAMLKELKRTDTVVETAEGLLSVRKMFSRPSRFDEDFLKNIGFAMANLGGTLVRNAELMRSDDFSDEGGEIRGFLERTAWTESLSVREMRKFRDWVRENGSDFILSADRWVGEHEQLSRDDSPAPSTVAGVGIYYFENPKRNLD